MLGAQVGADGELEVSDDESLPQSLVPRRESLLQSLLEERLLRLEVRASRTAWSSSGAIGRYLAHLGARDAAAMFAAEADVAD